MSRRDREARRRRAQRAQIHPPRPVTHAEGDHVLVMDTRLAGPLEGFYASCSCGETAKDCFLYEEGVYLWFSRHVKAVETPVADVEIPEQVVVLPPEVQIELDAVRGEDTVSTLGVVWKEPPANALIPNGKRTRINSFAAIAEQLRGRPNVWAMVRQYPSVGTANSTARKIKHGQIDGFKEGTWEVAVESAGNRGGRLYVRYVVEQQTASMTRQRLGLVTTA